MYQLIGDYVFELTYISIEMLIDYLVTRDCISVYCIGLY